MNMRIKARKGNVTFVMRAGKDFVQNTMPLSSAECIIEKAKVKEDKQVEALNNDFFRCVDDTYFFPLEEVPARKTTKKEDAQ